ncbi:MAG: UDP-glucose/GDP-mannose dehydrogenase family protein [Acidobacteriota bacterium]
MKVAVIGTGYVGLVTGACFASKGHDVICVDLDAERVASINRGSAPFYEPGLEELLRQTVGTRLKASLDLDEAVIWADVTLLAVGTPFDGERIDLRQIKAASRQVGHALRDHDGYALVMVKSTVLPGTTNDVVRPILEEASGKRAGHGFGLAMNPEFLREGQAVIDFLQPDRVVMGGMDPRCWEVQEELYRDFPAADLVRTDNATAEMTKYTSNSLLATLISFSNEIANLCSTLPGVDVLDVMRGVHLDKRLSPLDNVTGERIRPGILAYLMAGCGFGGSCLPKDVNSLIAFAADRDRSMPLLRSVLEINVGQPTRLADLATAALAERHGDDLSGATVAVLGLAFKPGTSDIRETPALPVIEHLRRTDASLRLWDPAAIDEVKKVLGDAPDLHYTVDLADAVAGADVLVVLTSWPELSDLAHHLADADPQPLVLDGRRSLDRTAFARYDGVGLGPEDNPG